MRFITDLSRYIILGLCGLALVGFVFVALTSADGPADARSLNLVLSVGAGVVAIVAVIAVLALLHALHDRHAKLVDEIEQTNELLTNIATSLEHIAARETAR